MPAVDSQRRNPYKGPYAFTLKDAALFTGRDEEAETLLSLAISERVVVFCAPSGAGKSSLLNARLIPGLRRGGFKVLPVVRVGGDLPPGVNPENVFAFNALWILAGSKADPETLQSCTLDAFLRPIPHARGKKGPPRVLIFDQLEEILTTHVDRWAQRKDFFLQLRQALLDDPTLSVVMSLREDHLAGFDTYAPLLPGQLRTRFRMETLRRDKAVAAARQPALAAGLPFDPDVAERLVEDLSRVRMAGQEESVPGEFVEPVQLQVVCYQLWENLRNQPGKTITEDDRRQFGDPDQTLEGFYESAVQRAAEKTGVPETQIRHWCGTALITPTHIRSQVNREPEASGGLPNPAIDSLVDSHLVRAEAARGGIWYELAHDRFVEPILRSNQKAAPSSATRLSEDARAWLKAGRDPSFLYSGLRLEDAMRTSREAGALLSPQESEFLAHSQKAEADAEVRQTRQLWFAVAVLALLMLAAAGSAYTAWQQRRLAIARELALAATAKAEDDPELGLLLALEAVQKAPIPETEAALHEALRVSVVRQDRSLATDSDSPNTFAFSRDGQQCAALDGSSALSAWETASGTRIDATRPVTKILSLAYGPGGVIAYGDAEGRVNFWAPSSSGRPPFPPLTIGFPIGFLAYSPDGSRLAIAGGSSDVKIWNIAANTFETIPGGEPGTIILNAAFSQDGRFLAIVPEVEGEEGQVIIQDLRNPRPHGRLLRHPTPVTSVAFGPHGQLATGSRDTGLRIWLWTDAVVLQTLYGHRNQISDVAFSPDGEYVATASDDGDARLWNLWSGEAEHVLAPEGGKLSKVAFSPQADKLATVSQRGPGSQQMGTLTMWDIALDKDLVLPFKVRGLAGFTPDSQILTAVDPEGRVFGWSFSTQKRPNLPSLEGTAGIFRAWLTSRGEFLALRGDEFLRQPVSPPGKMSRRKLPSGLGYTSFAISREGRLMALAQGKAVHLLDLVNPGGTPSRFELEPEGSIPGLEQEGSVVAMAFAPQGTWLALARDSGPIELWSVAEKRLGPVLKSPGGARAHDIEISPDGRWLASAGDDRKVRLWELKTGTLQQTFEGHAGRVLTVTFSPDGRRLASGDVEGKISLWEIDTGRNIFDLRANTLPVLDLAFSPDGKWLVILGSDDTLRREPMALDALIDRARQRVSRKLTDQERRIYLHQK